MRLSAVKRSISALSPALPQANRYLAKAGVVPRRGQLSVVAGAPGSGKTALASALGAFMRVPTLYFSADSDEWTVRTRSCALLTMTAQDEIDRNLNENEEAWGPHYHKVLSKIDHIDWCFTTDIDPEYIALRIEAYAEIHGEYPHLIVVDNLTNTAGGDADEYRYLREIMRELLAMARVTKAHVMALHHVKGHLENGDKEVRQGDLLGNLAKLPEIVLGVHRVDPQNMGITVAKNRAGKSGHTIHVPIDFAKAYVDGFLYAA